MNDIAPEPVDIVDAILSRMGSYPSLVAVENSGVATCYGDLGTLAARVAGAIKHITPTPSPRVLIALPSSAAAYAGMLGSLMAGGTFCAINLSLPEGRNAEIGRVFCPDVILHDGTPPAFFDTIRVTTPTIDILQPGTRSLATPVADRSDIAYVVFTSGSTGHPKGVKVGRRAFSYFLQVAQEYFNLDRGERWGQFSNLGHDLGVMDVFMALTQGATLVPLDNGERLRPAMAVRDKRLSVWQSVPSVIELMLRARQLTAENLTSLRIMSFCGEPLLPHHLDALFEASPNMAVFNTYGATETIGFNTINRLTRGNYKDSCQAGIVAIGDDVPGWNLHLRGRDSIDEGEIVVTSDFLSLGYWQDETGTSTSFRQVDFGDGITRRSYFTGDRGVRRGARLFCSGRLDRQVKIRGERIELDEIDGLLREAGFRAAYTIMKGEELYSFVETEEIVDQERVRSHLKSVLPFHAVPKSVSSLPALPRNANGKIDRDALVKMVTS